jgi:argininosuccinate lyase
MVLQMEMVLSQKLGNVTSGRVPIGRSRLDQGATARRMVDRNSLQHVIKHFLGVQDSLISAAAIDPMTMTQEALTTTLDYTEFVQKSLSARRIGPLQSESSCQDY